MAKRGDRLPFRVRFEYGNGVKGTKAHYTREDAERFTAQLDHYAELRDTTVTHTITDTREKD